MYPTQNNFVGRKEGNKANRAREHSEMLPAMPSLRTPPLHVNSNETVALTWFHACL